MISCYHALTMHTVHMKQGKKLAFGLSLTSLKTCSRHATHILPDTKKHIHTYTLFLNAAHVFGLFRPRF